MELIRIAFGAINKPAALTNWIGDIWFPQALIEADAATILTGARPVRAVKNLETGNVQIKWEDLQPDLVMVKRNGAGGITAMYFGGVDYSVNPPKWVAYPINQVVSAATSNEISGTLSSLKDSAGLILSDVTTSVSAANIRTGAWSHTAGSLPLGWPSSGRFIVFRSSGTDSTVSPTIMTSHILRPQKRLGSRVRSVRAVRK